MWDDLWGAIALLLVFEGVIPFISPVRWRTMLQLMAQQPDKVLRGIGLASMLAGLLVLYTVR
jgi:uncharacterized protein YjeT (DUF2065 family)